MMCINNVTPGCTKPPSILSEVSLFADPIDRLKGYITYIPRFTLVIISLSLGTGTIGRLEDDQGRQRRHWRTTHPCPCL